jgi:hypothetical protein
LAPAVDAATASLRPSASAPPSDAWTWFDSSDHGYRIAYPPTLQLKDPANTSDFLAIGAGHVANLTVEPQPAGVDLDGYVKAFEEATLKDVGSGPVTSRLVEVDGRSWRVLEYLMDANGTPVWAQYALTMRGQDGIYLVVIGPTDADTLADERRGFEQMLGTITLSE